MRHYEQTNIQLFNQLNRMGYSETDLADAGAAYFYAAKMFTGCYRPSGKVFLAHLVGTASILAELQRPIATIVAGLLHSVYTHGEFGDGRRGISRRKRAEVQRVLGCEAEELIAAYTNFRWDEKNIPLIQQKLSAFNAVDREALLMRLANELDDHLDLVALYSGYIEWHRRAIKTYLSHCVDLARQLGLPSLAEELADAFEETLSTELPEVLKQTSNSYKSARRVFLLDWESSFLLAPLSHRARAPWKLRRFFRRELRARLFRLQLNLARLKSLPRAVQRRARGAWRHGHASSGGTKPNA